MLEDEVHNLHRKRIEEVTSATMRAITEVRMHPPEDALTHMVIVSGTIYGVARAAAMLAAREPTLHGHEEMVFGDVAAAFRQFYYEEKSEWGIPAGLVGHA